MLRLEAYLNILQHEAQFTPRNGMNYPSNGDRFAVLQYFVGFDTADTIESMVNSIP